MLSGAAAQSDLLAPLARESALLLAVSGGPDSVALMLLAARWPQLNTKITPGTAKNFSGPPRALDTSLNITKIQKILSVPLPGLGEWLAANPNEKF